MEMTGCDLSVLGSGYRSSKTAVGLLEAINEEIQADIFKQIAESEFISVSCDETTYFC